jgi:transposase-like protein
MVAAKTFQEWYAFFGGEEMQVSRDEAAVVWEAATKAAEARFTSHNTASTPVCPKCDYEYPHLFKDGHYKCDECGFVWVGQTSPVL